jgi:2-keto-3-deoxy-L-arabinonate dehydratase
MTKRDIFSGVHAVLYALFSADESLDHAAMTQQVHYCVDSGCHGITVLGLATEVLKLTLAERKALIATVNQANAGRLPFSVTIAGNSVAEQAELAIFAAQNGADWLILQPPMVGSYGAAVYLEFFERVARQVNIPVAVQNAPQYLGRALSGEDIALLRSRCANLAAVKSEDAALSVERIIHAAGDGLAILGGRGGIEMIDNLRLGCQGFVLAPDIAPIAAKIFDLWHAGATDEAERLYGAALPAINFVMQSLEHLITYGKRIFAQQAGLTVHDRAPCLGVTAFGTEAANRYAAQLDAARLAQAQP